MSELTNSPVTIFHNPRCSKSRETLKLLLERGIAPQVVHYLDTPLSVADLRELRALLNVPVAQLLRPNEPPFVRLGLQDPNTTDEVRLAALAAHPILLQRPIVRAGNRAVIGRPPAAVLAIL